MDSLGYWQYVRIFHILLGAMLTYIGVQHFRGEKTPRSFYQLIIVLGALAVVYHAYKLAVSLGYLKN